MRKMNEWHSPSSRALARRTKGVTCLLSSDSYGRERIMGIQPNGLHQRLPVILGSRNEVECIACYHKS